VEASQFAGVFFVGVGAAPRFIFSATMIARSVRSKCTSNAGEPASPPGSAAAILRPREFKMLGVPEVSDKNSTSH
jgi:hypothetical protein